MVPAYLEKLQAIPVMPSGKADRKRLPPPTGPRLQATGGVLVAPGNDTERALAAVLANVLEVDEVSVDGHFFDELGANSLLMARYNAALREHTALPSVSMKDIYLHPTVRKLAASLEPAMPSPPSGAAQPPVAQPPPVLWSDPVPAAPPLAGQPSGTPHYFLCGALQLLTAAAGIAGGALLLNAGFAWTLGARGPLDAYLRLVAFGSSTLLGLGVLPIGIKWLLIGRWKPASIRAWSLGYFRFWLVKTVVVANPMARLFIGTPLYTLYLRALGARIGRRATILTQHIPVCTDLLFIGADSLITKDTYISCYRARAGLIETGYVSVGASAFIGEHSVLDIKTAVGEGAQLGHASALLTGQMVPPGEIWHGSPAERAPDGTVYQVVPPARCGALRRAWSCVPRLLLLLAVAGPVEAGVASLLVTHSRALLALLGRPRVTSWPYYREALTGGAAVVFGLTLAGLLIVGPAGRLLSRLLRPGRVYPLYGLRHGVLRAVTRMSNIKFFNALLGDSSAIAGYLSYLGYRLGPCTRRARTSAWRSSTSPDAQRRRHRDAGLRRAVHDQRGVLRQLVPRRARRHREEQLPRQRHRLPARRPDRRQLPARHQGHDPGLRAGPGGSRPARLALLRDPPLGQPRPAASASSAGPGQRTLLRAKNRHNAVTMMLFLLVRWLYVSGSSSSRCCRWAATPPLAGTLGTAGTVVADLLFTTRSTSCSSTGRSPGSARCGRSSAPSTSRLSGGTSGSGRSRRSPTSRCSTAPRSRASSGDCLACGSAAGSSTTAARSSSGAWSAWAATARSTPGASSSAIPWRTAPSSPTTPSSGPAAASGASPSSTTGSRWAKAPRSTPTPS